MAGAKVKVGYEVHPDAHEMLKTIVERYKLPDESKALRCLLDYAATDGDWDADGTDAVAKGFLRDSFCFDERDRHRTKGEGGDDE